MQALETIDTLRRLMHREQVFKDLNSPIERYDDVTFRSLYRFTKPTVGKIINLIEEDLARSTKRNCSLKPEEQMFIALRFYATNTFQKDTADVHGKHQTTVARSISRVSFALAKLRPDFVKFPSNNEHAQAMALFNEIVSELSRSDWCN